MAITASVGKGGVNLRTDTVRIQEALNLFRQQHNLPLLKVDGIVGPKTIAAITNFQQSYTRIVDGRIDPHGPTLQALEQFVSAACEPQVRAYVQEILGDLKSTLATRGLQLPASVQTGLDAVQALASNLASGPIQTKLPTPTIKPSRLPLRQRPSGRRNA
ncbi:MAG: hypothetical protein JNK87_22990 [Bryobacterales bacterium]|nr:hypothetical protein [Bryobacterales bacterium]